MPNTLTIIEERMFESCVALVSIELPVNLEIIGDSAFSACHSLKTIELPETIMSLGAFLFCSRNKFTNHYYSAKHQSIKLRDLLRM